MNIQHFIKNDIIEATDRLRLAEQVADADLEERLLVLIARLEQRVAGALGKISRSPVRLLELLCGMVFEITAVASPGPDVYPRQEVLERAIVEGRRRFPELFLVRQQGDHLSPELAAIVYAAWRHEPGERREVFMAVARGLVALVEILLRTMRHRLADDVVRARFAETAAVFVSDLETLAIQPEF